MKNLVILKHTDKRPFDADLFARLGYSEVNSNGYHCKPFVGQMDVIALSSFAAKHGLEAYICDAKSAHSIHGLSLI